MSRPNTFSPGEFWEWHEAHQDELTALHGRLDESLEALPLERMINTLDWPENAIVADLGGGTGVFLVRLLTERPDLRGILVDRGAVLQAANERLSRFSGHISIVETDLSEDAVPEADVYTLVRTLHNFTDVEAIRILDNLRNAAPEASILRIIDVFLSEDRASPDLAVQQDEKMQRYFESRQHTVSELTHLLAHGGWLPGKYTEVSDELAVLEATRKS